MTISTMWRRWAASTWGRSHSASWTPPALWGRRSAPARTRTSSSVPLSHSG
ncbi:hypothetical protein E2C01_077712 [Portunus trituberculatus]|uniref:Uncharacterized protein n=1 Tax=Portunus trituberculatus TaxID=210409 RepID=A0A5B7IKX5_PORTR|nr:hypothetical protein [Portunus trituberculatus]